MNRGLVAWGPAALWAAVLFLLSALHRIPGEAWLPPGGDKVGHFLIYGVLGMTLAWGRARRGAPVFHAWPLSFAVLYALSDEWHQSFVPGRDPSGADLAADFLGSLTGYGVALLFQRRHASPEGDGTRQER